MNEPLHLKRTERLRRAGLRATGSRLAILTALEEDRRHPTAEMIHETLQTTFPSLSLSTVYATLETFVRLGLLRRVSPQGGRLRVDGTTDDHDHAVCRTCGAVFDVDRGHLPRPATPDRLPEGLTVLNVHIEYEVVCPDCAGAPAGTTDQQ